MNQELNDLAARAGIRWFDYQLEAFEYARQQDSPPRLCLYYKTGAGKTITGLTCMRVWDQQDVLVLAPPSTHDSWIEWGLKLGVLVHAISHAKFRQKDYRVSRTQAIIVDEFHLLGGHGKKGWKKMDTLARHLQAPLILMSATPNYNDAERVYCIQHVLDPHSCKGGYIEFLYRHCETEQNPFGREPVVTGFKNYTGDDAAAQYLADLPHVMYLPDDLVYTINDIGIPAAILPELDTYGYNAADHKMVASIIEERHLRIFRGLVEVNTGLLRPAAYDVLADLAGYATTPMLVYANHATVADALGKTLRLQQVKHAVVTGSTPAKKKAAYIDAFRDGVLDVLVGTASLATGTDGLDKVCDWLVILDDTDDASLRRQLVGRIMPRGEGGDASKKNVYRLVLQ